jgi:hypothetical protein
MTERDEAIERLRQAIHAKTAQRLTFEQVAHYVGSDTGINTIRDWVNDTEQGRAPVTVDDVLDLWGD